jgi:hypothetical protein
LAVGEPLCGGAEWLCNDDHAGLPTSEVLRKFTAKEQVLVTVDGKVGSSGNAVLNATRVTCAPVELTGQSLPVTLTTTNGSTTHEGVCAALGAPERAYRWQTAVAGL